MIHLSLIPIAWTLAFFVAAVIFVPIYNFFAGRQPAFAMQPGEEHREHA